MEQINLENLSPEIIKYINALKSENSSLQKENVDLKNKVQKQEQFISNLTEMLVNDRKKMFGRLSEQMKYIEGAEQISLFNEAEKESAAGVFEPDEKTLVATHERSRKRTKEELTKGLEHIKQVCEITPAVCPDCGEPLTEIGVEFVRSELNIIPAQIFVIDIYQKRYKCEHCSDDEQTNIFKAPTPVPVIKKSMATAATIAYVMQQKYQLGLPLYRMEQYWDAEGVELKRNTLANWIIRGSLWFRPLWERMREILLSEDIIHADETPLRVLKRDGQQLNSQSRMWVFCSGKNSEHKMSLYYHHATRSGKVAQDILGNYSGYLQTDGYAGYNILDKVTHIGCFAHAKRYFVQCVPKGISEKDSKAAHALALIGRIFAKNESFVDVPEITGEQRTASLKPLFDEFFDYISTINAPGGSKLEKAVNYSLNQRKQLENTLLDSRLELTNNIAERAIAIARLLLVL